MINENSKKIQKDENYNYITRRKIMTQNSKKDFHNDTKTAKKKNVYNI